ncbi:MAG: ATPase [Candidatus Eisenbacteria bacterium]|uniref:ATPase n=1 Tax=Eiseniibacteriota bacterium TaxID=2212470 RepID=A0A849STB9_UNCEI|nr:ATPase [Candidatus Eisenbacteria bacterium]
MIRKSVVLPCSPARAFDLWTQAISDWWPLERRHTNDPNSEIFVLETGRFYERARDGQEVELGRVRSWRRAEGLDLDFYPGTDVEHPTRVTVTFAAEGEATRVTVEHRPTAESEGLWDRRSPRYAESWDQVLHSLLGASKP